MDEVLVALVAFVGALNIFNLRLFQKSKRPERKSIGEIARENRVFNWRLSEEESKRFHKKSKAIYYPAFAKYCLARLSPLVFYTLFIIFYLYDLKLGSIVLAPIMLILSVLSFMVIIIYGKWISDAHPSSSIS